MSRLFITATGTDIGKTLVTCALVSQLRAKGNSIRAIKPIISGYTDDTMDTIDTAEIIKALGQKMTPETIAQVSPWRFTHPLAPDMAAIREGRSIHYGELVDFCRERHGEDHLIIEGVGGAFVPIDDEHLVVDLINDLDISALVVVGAYLGTISHTVATVEALRGRGVTVSGIVISEAEPGPVPLEELQAALKRLLPDLPMVSIPQIDHWSEAPDLTVLV